MPGVITPEELEELIHTGRDKAFLIVDIRKPEEYRLDHIPGAVNIPLPEISCQRFLPEPDRKMIFYCRAGRRSKAAALLAVDAGVEPGNCFSLDGGISAYTGEILMEIPRVELFVENMP